METGQRFYDAKGRPIKTNSLEQRVVALETKVNAIMQMMESLNDALVMETNEESDENTEH